MLLWSIYEFETRENLKVTNKVMSELILHQNILHSKYMLSARMSTTLIWANQPIHSFLVGSLHPFLSPRNECTGCFALAHHHEIGFSCWFWVIYHSIFVPRNSYIRSSNKIYFGVLERHSRFHPNFV